MKVFVVSGSRNPNGQTARALNALVDGVKRAGGRAEVCFLPTMKVERCRQCNDAGWGTCRSEGRCCIEDDFAGLVAQIREADAVVFATPVYFSDLSESLRAFLDRLRRITRHEAGKQGVTDKVAMGICVAGGGGGGAPSCCAILQGILATCGFAVVDMAPVRRQNLDAKCQVLRETGAWFAQTVSSGSG